MMLVVLAVTSATLYLAGNNLRANQQKNLDTQFQSAHFWPCKTSRRAPSPIGAAPSPSLSGYAPLWKSETSTIFTATL